MTDSELLPYDRVAYDASFHGQRRATRKNRTAAWESASSGAVPRASPRVSRFQGYLAVGRRKPA